MVSQSNISKYGLTTHIGAELGDGQTRERLQIPFPQREQGKQTPNPPNLKKCGGRKKLLRSLMETSGWRRLSRHLVRGDVNGQRWDSEVLLVSTSSRKRGANRSPEPRGCSSCHVSAAAAIQGVFGGVRVPSRGGSG